MKVWLAMSLVLSRKTLPPTPLFECRRESDRLLCDSLPDSFLPVSSAISQRQYGEVAVRHLDCKDFHENQGSLRSQDGSLLFQLRKLQKFRFMDQEGAGFCSRSTSTFPPLAPYSHPKSKEQPCIISTVARKLLLLLVSRAGLEPATHWLKASCSTD